MASCGPPESQQSDPEIVSDHLAQIVRRQFQNDDDLGYRETRGNFSDLRAVDRELSDGRVDALRIGRGLGFEKEGARRLARLLTRRP